MGRGSAAGGSAAGGGSGGGGGGGGGGTARRAGRGRGGDRRGRRGLARLERPGDSGDGLAGASLGLAGALLGLVDPAEHLLKPALPLGLLGPQLGEPLGPRGALLGLAGLRLDLLEPGARLLESLLGLLALLADPRSVWSSSSTSSRSRCRRRSICSSATRSSLANGIAADRPRRLRGAPGRRPPSRRPAAPTLGGEADALDLADATLGVGVDLRGLRPGRARRPHAAQLSRRRSSASGGARLGGSAADVDGSGTAARSAARRRSRAAGGGGGGGGGGGWGGGGGRLGIVARPCGGDTGAGRGAAAAAAPSAILRVATSLVRLRSRGRARLRRAQGSGGRRRGGPAAAAAAGVEPALRRGAGGLLGLDRPTALLAGLVPLGLRLGLLGLALELLLLALRLAVGGAAPGLRRGIGLTRLPAVARPEASAAGDTGSAPASGAPGGGREELDAGTAALLAGGLLVGALRFFARLRCSSRACWASA